MWIRNKKKVFLSNVCIPLGEYFVVGIDIEQYDSSAPDKYLRGVLQVKTDPSSEIAFRSYLAIVPSAPVLFSEFARLVGMIGFSVL